MLSNGDLAANWVAHTFGASGMALVMPVADLFPRGVALGLALLFSSALLVAAVVGLPPLPAPVFAPAIAAPFQHRRLRVLSVVAAVLSALSAVALVPLEPSLLALVLWCGALAAAGLVAATVDRNDGVTFGNPFSRLEWMGLAALMVAEVALIARDLGDWRWAGLPDESFFFATAKAIVEGRLQRFPLSESGVFGYHPVLSSYYQALFMKVFGVGVVGWRLSSAVALTISLPFAYLFTREVWNRRAAWAAAVLFGCAQVPVGFAHLGYNNAQVYPVILATLGILIWSLHHRSVTGCYVAGIIAGLGFYTFYSARLSPVLAVMLLWAAGMRRRGGPVCAVALGVGLLLASLPVLMHPAATWSHMLQQTAVGQAHTDWTQVFDRGTIAKLLHGWLPTLVYAAWARCGWNFGWLPVIDPVTAILSVIGGWLALGALWRGGTMRFLAPAYLLASFVVGATSPYDCPPLTRLLTLVPFTAVFAGAALDRIMACVAGGTRPRWVTSAGVVAVAAAVAWNISALHVSMYHRHHGYGDGTTGELIRVALPLPRDCKLVYIQHSDNDMYDVDQILDEYGLGSLSTYIRPFGPRVEETLSSLTPPFAVVYDLRLDEQRRSVEDAVARRFPETRWSDSAPGKPWSLRYTSSPAGLMSPPEPRSADD